ncbi:MAG TPA: ferredoxin [Streptomyces sp.]|jgi:ferredoxin|nr:ferredoxin [Streptomyces sp.]
MKIVADTGKCVGAGLCALTEPEMFDQREEDGTVVVLDAELGHELLVQKARRVVRTCPSQALSLVEHDG